MPAGAGCDATVTVYAPQINNVCVEVFSITYQVDSETPVSVTPPQPVAGVTTLPSLDVTLDVGVHTVTWIITDASGTPYPCVISIEVTDSNASLLCPQDITRAVDEELLDYASNVPTGSPAVTNNCENPSLEWTLTPPAGYESKYPNATDKEGTGVYPTGRTFWLGVTTITYSLVDSNGDVIIGADGNPLTCPFTVTVTNHPVIDCPEDMEWDAGETCTYDADPDVPELTAGSHPLIWTYTIDWADGRPDTYVEFDEETEGQNGPSEIGVLTLPEGTTTITWTATDQFGNTDTCIQEIKVTDNTQPTFVPEPQPFETCVDPLHSAVYNPANPDPFINHTDPNLVKVPSPDFFTFVSGNPALNLDMDDYHDNCCTGEDIWTINWQIDFTDVPNPLAPGNISHPPVSGTGQPSAYGSDIQLWGDGVQFATITHTITYIITDCNGNDSEPIVREIVITPRPQIIKMTP